MTPHHCFNGPTHYCNIYSSGEVVSLQNHYLIEKEMQDTEIIELLISSRSTENALEISAHVTQ